MSLLKPLFNYKKKEIISNPLLLPQIRERILGCMEVKELLNFRHVNKQWNEICTNFLQKKVLIVLRTWNSVHNFVAMYTSSKRPKPFKILKLESTLLLKDGNLQEALGKIGLHFTSLVICCHCSAEELTLLLYKIFTNLVDLKITGSIPSETLFNKMKPLPLLTSVNFHLTNKKPEQLAIRKFASDLFSVTPNLTSVVWGTVPTFTDLLPRAMFHCIIESQGLASITHFSCTSLIFGIRDLKELAAKTFPLSRLEVSIGTDVPSGILGNFLELHGETLTILHLSFGPDNSITIKILGHEKMKKLCTLTLEDYKRSLRFIVNLTMLKKLVLINSNTERAFSVDWDEEEVNCLPKLDVFEVYAEPWRKVQPFPMAAVVRLAHYFPKLRILRLQNLDDKCLRRVFKNFLYLTELRAPCGTYTDDAFKVLSAAAKFLSNSTSDGCARSSVNNLQYSYSLANLISLRKLEIDSICMSDEFILEGVIKWRGLRHLGLKNCRVDQSTLTRILMEMDLHCLLLESCEIVSQYNNYEDRETTGHLEMGCVKDCIKMNYGDIKKWRLAIFQLLSD